MIIQTSPSRLSAIDPAQIATRCRGSIFLIFTAFLMLSFLSPSTVYSQASLAAENTIDDIKVTTKYGKEKVYTVFQDATVPEQWYYMPNELRVAEEVDVNKKVRPKMTILRYQYQDVKTKENKEGGILVATFTYAIEPEVIQTVINHIKSKKGLSQARLSAIPLNSSTIDFLASSGEFIGNINAKVSFDGATSASQEIVISYDLTVLGAGVFNSLASSKGGIPILANITYNGLTAPCGFNIEGEWDNVYKYFEEQSKTEAGIKLWKFNAGGSRTKQTLRESLEKIQGMTVEVVECEQSGDEGADQKQDDANMNDIIKKFQDAVFNNEWMERGEELERLQSLLTSTNDEDAKKRILDIMTGGEKAINLGYQKSIQDVQKRRTGKLSYNFARQRMVVRPTSFGGLLSYSKYGLSEEDLINDGYIIDLDANKDFPSVIIGLPAISPNLDLRSLVLEVKYTNSDGRTHSEARQWAAESGKWTTPMGVPVEYLRFNLIGEKDKSKVNEPEFDMVLKVISKIPNASFTINKIVKLNSGEKFADALELLTDQVVIDGSVLGFTQITQQPNDLTFAQVEIQKGALSISESIKPYFTNGIPTPPDPVYLLFPKDGTPFTSSKVTYYKRTGAMRSLVSGEKIGLSKNTLQGPNWPKEAEE